MRAIPNVAVLLILSFSAESFSYAGSMTEGVGQKRSNRTSTEGLGKLNGGDSCISSWQEA